MTEIQVCSNKVPRSLPRGDNNDIMNFSLFTYYLSLKRDLWANLDVLYPRMLCVKFGWNCSSGSWEEDLHFVNVVLQFRNYLPFEKNESLHLKMLCAKFGWNWSSGFGEVFYISSMYFRYFIISLLWRAGPFIWTNLNSQYPRMLKLCAKFDWNWPSGYWKEDENVKSLQQRRRVTTELFRSEKHTWASNSGVLISCRL